MLSLDINMLKNLFIPHQGNNYQPRALHPHRLLFHGVSAIFIKTIIVIAVLALPSSAWLTPDVLTAESEKIIVLTNNIRSEQSLDQLQENSLLNQAAFNKVQDMLIGQYFSHMSPENKNLLYWLKSVGYGYAVAGENLAMGFSSAQNVVAAWTKSRTHYANLIDPDFREIGVAMVSGSFKDHDTTMVAQYFGRSKVTAPVNATLEPQISKKPELVAVGPSNNIQPSIKGVKAESNIVQVDQTPPTLDMERTKIWVNQIVNHKDKVVMVEAYLSPDAVSGQVSFQNIIINLSQDPEQSNKWTGSAIIPNDEVEQTFSPVILATLTASDAVGNTLNTDINWSNFQEIKPSLVKQYLFIKNSQSRDIKNLLEVSRIYFILLLVVSIVALLLNVFIEIKRQHPHVIASALSLIALLVLLIIF
jgi:uncharacterized protein YkwD